jgi:hypothetical protein
MATLKKRCPALRHNLDRPGAGFWAVLDAMAAERGSSLAALIVSIDAGARTTIGQRMPGGRAETRPGLITSDGIRTFGT